MSLRPDVADHPARILIVDDERHKRQLLEVMLAPEGFLPLTDILDVPRSRSTNSMGASAG